MMFTFDLVSAAHAHPVIVVVAAAVEVLLLVFISLSFSLVLSAFRKALLEYVGFHDAFSLCCGVLFSIDSFVPVTN